ncbi:MAG: sirohydrochlorin cobaltochelatase [Desulfovibrio sp.]|jgi:sirohydrochlorin cobaltochelatase|nr:sirohydrochlorin cobaltochelatase [Desulfovibrio sp.]
MMPAKTGILLVAYGSPGAAAGKGPAFFESLVRRTFSSLPVYRAYSSERMRARRKASGGEADSVYTALCRMGSEHYERVVVQSLHLVAGLEYRALEVEIEEARIAGGGPRLVGIGGPLIRDGADADETAAALTAHIPEDRGPDEAVVCVGHGGQAADGYYALLEAAVAARDKRVLIGTLSGAKSAGKILEELRALYGGTGGSVRLLPLLASVGGHAVGDIAGAGPDSWRGRIEAAGFDCRVELKGIAEYEGFARIWISRLAAALGELENLRRPGGGDVTELFLGKR